jgi:hypothetical protein
LAGAVLDPVASSTSSTSEGGPVLSSWPWLRSLSWPVPCLMLWLLICSPGDGCGQFHQRSRAGAVVLVVVAVVVLAGAVLTSSNSSTSKAGPVLLPWS